MSYFNTQRPYYVDKPILGSKNFNSTTGVHLTDAVIGLDVNGRKTSPAGLFLAQVNGVDRFLPRQEATANVLTSAATVQVAHPELFLAGDVIYHVEGVNSIAVGGTWVAGDVITINLGAYRAAFTVTQTTAAGVATELAAYLASSELAKLALFSVDLTTATQVNIYLTGSNLDLVVSENSAAGTLTVTAPEFNFAYRLVGTISSIDYANSTLTLAANAAIELVAGAKVGTVVDKVYGLYNHSIDWEDRPSIDLKAIDRADYVYLASLPYFDRYLDELFPNMIVK